MPILYGAGASDPAEMWFGDNPLKEVWFGDQKIWPPAVTGPFADAHYWYEFTESEGTLKNKGITKQNLSYSGYYATEPDHIYIYDSGLLSTTPTTGWDNGYSVSMWVKNVLANSGWKTLIHRAVESGTLTNETYIVHNTSASAVTLFSGMKFGSTHREYSANYSPPVSSDWFHMVVVWARTSSTSYTCTFYINGMPRGSFTATGYPANSKFTNEKLYIGGGRNGGEWMGRMDDLAIWDRPLTADEVMEIYQKRRSFIPQILTQGPFEFVVGEPGGLYLAADFLVDSWSATGLPAGITLDTNTGYLSGTATTVGSGTMTITAVADGRTATKSFDWTTFVVPPLPNHAIGAKGANKVSHSGWARPNVTWSLVATNTGQFTSSGDLILPRGRGRIRFIGSFTTGRASRIVSNQRGILASAVSSKSPNFRTEITTFNEGERVYIELEGYTSTSGDTFLLSTDLT